MSARLANVSHLLGLARPRSTAARRASKPSAVSFDHLIGLEPSAPVDSSAEIAASWQRAFEIVAAETGKNSSIASGWEAAFRKAGGKR
jgi:hypothetical protein